MKTYLITSVCLMLYINNWAQKKPVFHSINQFGVTTGSSGESFSVQTINGIKYKQYSAGVGIGLDWYSTRTVPIFIDVRREFGQQAHKPFVYANLGASRAWWKGNISENSTSKIENHTRACWEAGAGYNIHLKNKTALVLSVGYSFKQVSYSQPYVNTFNNTWLPYTSLNRYDYYYKRIAIRAGISF